MVGELRARRQMLNADDEAALARLTAVLAERGWRAMSDGDPVWVWPVPRPQGVRLFRTGPAIYFDVEDPEVGFFVEGPLVRDESTPLLRYLSVDELIAALDRIEAWCQGRPANEIDADHLVRPVA